MRIVVPMLCLLVAASCVRDSSTPPRPRHTLRVAAQSGGKVVSEPPGISCGTVCEASFAGGTVVTLQVEPWPGVDFVGWDGVCTGRALCTLGVHEDLQVAARFVVAGTDRPVPAEMRPASDLDRDGIADDRDACPVEAAAGSVDGCPPASAEEAAQ